jgi:hypothetical protein
MIVATMLESHWKVKKIVAIQQGTVDWWATQPAEAQDEAFMEEGPYSVWIKPWTSLYKLAWQHKFISGHNGPTYDMNILGTCLQKPQQELYPGSFIMCVMPELFTACGPVAQATHQSPCA